MSSSSFRFDYEFAFSHFFVSLIHHQFSGVLHLLLKFCWLNCVAHAAELILLVQQRVIWLLCSTQVLVMLVGDPAYKFIHVEDFGYVVSYAPRTSYGDFQTMLPVSNLLLPQRSSH